MSVTQVYQIFDGDTGTEDTDRTEHDLMYRVAVDDVADGVPDVLSASAGGVTIPDVGQLVGGDRVVSKDARRDPENPAYWTVTCKLSDAEPDQDESPVGDEKVNVDIAVAVVAYEEVAYFDRNMKPVVNTAGQPFSNQPTRTYYDERITVSFLTGVVDQKNIDQCRGKTNSDTVTMSPRGYKRTFEPGTLKLVDTPIASRVIKGEYHWNVSYVLDYRADGWARKIFSTGRMERKTPTSKLTPVEVGRGEYATEDVPLDKDGKGIVDGVIAEAVPVADADPGERCYLTYELEGQATYKNLLRGVDSGQG